MKLNNHGMGDYTLELTKQELICLRSLVHVSGMRAANADDKHSVKVAAWVLRALCNAGVDINMED
jgi:hypothetical protein